MIPEAREVHLSRKDRKVLAGWCRSPVTLQRELQRARRVLVAAGGRHTVDECADGNFTPKAADVVGLYVAQRAKAIVLCVDEKPSIQGLERTQCYLKLPNGRALNCQSHDYNRHGITTLFAALEVA